MQNDLRNCVVFIKDAEVEKADASMVRYGTCPRTRERIGQVSPA